MNTYEQDAKEADICSGCSVDFEWTVSELYEDFAEDKGSDFTYPISGDHLTKYRGAK